MRAPVNWLSEYCAPRLDAAALAERLAMTGTEVERIEHHGVSALKHFVIGRVLEAEPHPQADRLKVCRVDVGQPQAATIVCGAPNVAAGQTVGVARPGAVMPDGSVLGRVTLQGIESEGMILAEDELAIGTDHAGIMVLSEDGLIPGTPLQQVLPVATEVLVLEITPNRPDCLSIYGVAREVHAATGAPLARPPWHEDPGGEGPLEGAEVEVSAPELCPRFTARVFEEVKVAPSPPWLKARLMAAGQRPISNVVDITNYVMLLTGQPLHAFDLDRVAGARLHVRRAHDGESMQTLDGQTRRLDPEIVVIEDAQGPTSIAGVMGGARSEVQDGTTRVLMEAANWDGANIHRTSLRLGLRTEASTRFEKQLQPEQALEAQAVAAGLMVELCGARLAPGTADIGGPGAAPPTIRLRDARIAGLLGRPVARGRSREILEALDFKAQDAPDGLDVTPPAFRRADITREADLIEEVARLDGLESLPATLPSRHGASGRLTITQRQRRRAADALAAQGLHEIVGWSFTSREQLGRLRLGDDEAVELQNPMSAEQAQLRTTLLGSLLDAAQRNLSHGAAALGLFETGAVYLPQPGAERPQEPHRVGALIAGPVRHATWREQRPGQSDFFAVKGVLAALLDTLRIPWRLESAVQPFLHPGRAAAVLSAGEPVGWLGEIHPRVASDWEIDAAIGAFELDLDRATAHARHTPLYEDLISYPPLRQDLAVVVADGVSAEQVLDVVRAAGAPLLAAAEVFDVYRDPERLGDGRVSLALRLSFRAADRTLTDAEVRERQETIAAALRDRLEGRIRAT